MRVVEYRKCVIVSRPHHYPSLHLWLAHVSVLLLQRGKFRRFSFPNLSRTFQTEEEADDFAVNAARTWIDREL
jgi:hypothetical protein